uniref:Uncharacterized protein LOC111110715 n=1 Tax=Crassostrea virginica TaxID=6565 RepID=A0A8B8BJ94_CRAVI|nr:uncharacterized protein LOC111110715 [Crassostrea virginica]XP_022303011.1 uncharacterized protein LOC111110715 [Crassostrea virginica]
MTGIRICVILVKWTLLYSTIILQKSVCRDVSKLPVHEANHCPQNQTDLTERSDAINCTDRSRYMCLPNEKFTKLFEFCFVLSKLGIPEGACLILKNKTDLDVHYCHSFTGGCPGKDYFSKDLLQYPSCTAIENGCFLADADCMRTTTINTMLDTTVEDTMLNTVEDTTEKEPFRPIYIVPIVLITVLFIVIVCVTCVCVRQKSGNKSRKKIKEQKPPEMEMQENNNYQNPQT